MVHPYLTYGTLLWGSALRRHTNALNILQKKAVRVIHKAAYNEHTLPLFVKCNILKFDDIYTYQTLQFMYAYCNDLLPLPLQSMYDRISDIHNYSTRQENNPRHVTYKSQAKGKSFIVRGPQMWHNLPKTYRDLRSKAIFKRNIKKYLMQKYSQ